MTEMTRERVEELAGVICEETNAVEVVVAVRVGDTARVGMHDASPEFLRTVIGLLDEHAGGLENLREALAILLDADDPPTAENTE